MHKSIVRYEIFTLNYLEIKLKVKSDRHYQKKKKKKKKNSSIFKSFKNASS